MTIKENIYGRKTWGPIIWHMYHTFAIHIINDNNSIEIFKLFNNSLGYILPCEECKNHFNFIIENIYLLDTSIKKDNLFFYTYKIHEIVNESLNKKNISFKKAYNIHKKTNNEEIIFIIKTIYQNLDYDKMSFFEYDKIMCFFISFCKLYPNDDIQNIFKKLISSTEFKQIKTPKNFQKFISQYFLPLEITKS